MCQANVNKHVAGSELGSLLQQPPTSPGPAQLTSRSSHRSSERLALLPYLQAPTSPTRKLLHLNVGSEILLTDLGIAEYSQGS